jgi:hypothetical protein
VAGFQVITAGRFLVFTEAVGVIRLLTSINGSVESRGLRARIRWRAHSVRLRSAWLRSSMKSWRDPADCLIEIIMHKRHRFLIAVLAALALLAPGAFANSRIKTSQASVSKAKKLKAYKPQKMKPYKAPKFNRKSNHTR